MVELRWPKPWYFTDRERNRRVRGPTTVEVEEDAVEHYKSRGWEEPESTDETESADDDSESDVEAESESDSESESSQPWRSYSAEEIEEMSYQKLREMAAESDRDDIDGSSKKEEIVEAFVDDIESDEQQGE